MVVEPEPLGDWLPEATQRQLRGTPAFAHAGEQSRTAAERACNSRERVGLAALVRQRTAAEGHARLCARWRAPQSRRCSMKAARRSERFMPPPGYLRTGARRSESAPPALLLRHAGRRQGHLQVQKVLRRTHMSVLRPPRHGGRRQGHFPGHDGARHTAGAGGGAFAAALRCCKRRRWCCGHVHNGL